MNQAPRPSDFDPTNGAVLQNLYGYYRCLREQAPVHYVAKLDEYIVTRHEDITYILANPALFSNEGAVRGSPLAAIPMLPTADDPKHALQRRLIARAFTPNAVRQLGSFAENAANQLIDRFVEQGSCDLVANFAYLFPMTLMGHLCDVPPDDANFRHWADALFAATSDPGETALVGAMEALMDFGQYILAKTAERKAVLAAGGEPSPDVLTALVKPGEQGETLSDEEFVIAAAMLLTAGHETTTKLIGNTVQLLLSNPAEAAALASEPDLLEAAIEESLRFESPAQGLWRRVAKDTHLAGVDLREGSIIFMAFGSANRDETVFVEPDRFNIRRDLLELRKHLAFGHGVHFCLGASLARLEGKTAIRTLLRRLPDLRLAPDRPATRSPLHWMRGWEVLPVSWDVGAAKAA